MRAALLAVLGLLAGTACASGGDSGVEPGCVADTDCDPTQICAGGSQPEAGTCSWVSGRPFAIAFVSAEVTGGGPDGTWDSEFDELNTVPDLQAGVRQGLGSVEACTDVVDNESSASFGSNVAEACMLTVFPAQPLTLQLWDYDRNPGGDDEDDLIDSWTFEGELGYAELLREPATKRLEGTWSTIFITVYDL